jgi:ABC-type antimicrobial peptide transport system permease subunit
MVAFAVLLCVLLLPFFQYMLSLGHGYEIGVFRALGLSKVKVWVRLFIENILLTGAALMLALCAALFFYRQFAFALLGVDAETEQLLLGYFGDIFGFVWQAYLYTVYMAVAVTLISSAFINVLISNNTPLKLLLSYK